MWLHFGQIVIIIYLSSYSLSKTFEQWVNCKNDETLLCSLTLKSIFFFSAQTQTWRNSEILHFEANLGRKQKTAQTSLIRIRRPRFLHRKQTGQQEQHELRQGFRPVLVGEFRGFRLFRSVDAQHQHFEGEEREEFGGEIQEFGKFANWARAAIGADVSFGFITNKNPSFLTAF